MFRKKSFIVITLLLSAIVFGAATQQQQQPPAGQTQGPPQGGQGAAPGGAPRQQQPAPKPTNLKVLPKNTSGEDVSRVMRTFNNALGVRCNYCHAPSKADPTKLDYASDEKPEKMIARSMISMAEKINIKYFGAKKGNSIQAVTKVNCNTCHRGKSDPTAKA